jgi:hypothetical protein
MGYVTRCGYKVYNMELGLLWLSVQNSARWKPLHVSLVGVGKAPFSINSSKVPRGSPN